MQLDLCHSSTAEPLNPELKPGRLPHNTGFLTPHCYFIKVIVMSWDASVSKVYHCELEILDSISAGTGIFLLIAVSIPALGLM
jgi:hypothetical protein